MRNERQGDVWFTSDTHYGHANIIRFCNRPYSDVQEMNNSLIENYNALVKPSDTVYILGDFCFSRNPDAIFNRLNGNKHLILGNHDRLKHIKHLRWAWIKDVYKLSVGKRTKIWLSHYAHRTWPHSHKGSIHLYGHSHGDLEDWGKSTDVGVDAWDYKPVHLDTILKMMEKRDVTNHH